MRKQRDAYFDNAKLFLMILVVFGHFFQPFMDKDPVYNDLYYFIFLFHMPAFILISGFFSKGKPKTFKKLVVKLLIPYLFFQLIYSGYYTMIGLQDKFSFDLVTPQWALWFLLSLFFWNCLLKIVHRFPAKYVIGASILLALVVGYFPIFGRYLAAQRTLTFFPYFIIGYYLPKEWIEKIKQFLRKSVAVLLFAGLFVFVACNDLINKYWVFGSKPYEAYLDLPVFGAPLRMLFLTAGLIGIAAFFLVVPTKRYFFSKWGKNTLNVYLLHGFLVQGLRALDIDQVNMTVIEVVALFLFSIIFTVALSSEWCQNWMQRIKSFVFYPVLS